MRLKPAFCHSWRDIKGGRDIWHTGMRNEGEEKKEAKEMQCSKTTNKKFVTKKLCVDSVKMMRALERRVENGRKKSTYKHTHIHTHTRRYHDGVYTYILFSLYLYIKKTNKGVLRSYIHTQTLFFTHPNLVFKRSKPRNNS